uniref:M48 family metallopeptidase n=1 Tax=Cellvibrio fontiphilus TaxID=1815559 RepID=UPI002B4BE30F|nr:SprT family zinc-dependent metalloprotease [Cellvibrio fontiphilus]
MVLFSGLKKAGPTRGDGWNPGFEFTIARSARRRSISIEIRRAQVVIRAPIAVPDSILLDFLQQKTAWVKQKIAEQTQRLAQQPEPVEPNYAQGSKLRFMDECLTLVLGRGAQAAVQRVDHQLHVILSSRSRVADEQQIQQLLMRWYQQQALRLLSAKTAQLCASMGLVCSAVSVKATRSKWGHCTSRGAIQYNWNILLAPEHIVDYLVAHEVCHLRHPNHSRDFWALVASVCPSFATDRAWLKANGAQLSL